MSDGVETLVVVEQDTSLTVMVEGAITESNFENFKEFAEERIRSLNFEPETDEEFGQADLDSKDLQKFEKSLQLAEDEVLRQMEDVYALITGIGDLKGQSKKARLKLQKKVKEQKEEISLKIKEEALSTIPFDHPDAGKRIADAMKGKRKIETMRDAATQEAKKIEHEVQAARKIVEEAKSEHGDSIAYEERRLLAMAPEALRVEMDRRIERARSTAEMERLRIKAEAEAETETAKVPAPAPATAVSSPAPLPEPQKVGSIPVGRSVPVGRGPEKETEAEEMARFIKIVVEAFKPVGGARKALVHPRNRERAEIFATEISAAWSKFKKVDKAS